MRHAHFGGHTPGIVDTIALTGIRLAAPNVIGHGFPATKPTTGNPNAGLQFPRRNTEPNPGYGTAIA